MRAKELAKKDEKNKLRLDFTPSEMGMLLGISLRLESEPDLKKKWDTLLSRITYIGPEGEEFLYPSAFLDEPLESSTIEQGGKKE